ncbi:MAG: hypothetical protein O9340_12105 [Cyclobacteriaceae bacterium]|jgi:hypothetical protein|nr:hypothetical protein [Cyclobacteriaceae bacterium]
MKWTKQGNWYVDSFYGNDVTGTGTKLNPFKTITKAQQASSNNHTIICSGIFSEVVPPGKQLYFEGDGLCICTGLALTIPGSIMFQSHAYLSIKDFTFYKFQGNFFALAMTSAGLNNAYNCQFYFCNIGIASGGGTSSNYNNCIFYETLLGSNTVGMILTFQNNTVVRCGGLLGGSSGLIIGSVCTNNHFEECETLTINLPVNKPVNSEFDYNTIIGTVVIGGSAKAQAGQVAPSSANTITLYGSGTPYQQNGKGHLTKAMLIPTEQFLVTNNFNDINWYKCCFSLKSDSINAGTGKGGANIGARNVGYLLSANTIWTNRNVSSVNNLNYDLLSDEIIRINELLPGTLETNEIDLGAVITCDIAQLSAQIFDPTLSSINILGKVDYNADPPFDSSIDQKTVFDFELQYGTTSGALTNWKKFEFNKPVTIDINGNGNADDSYNVGNGIRITCRYIKLRIALRPL